MRTRDYWTLIGSLSADPEPTITVRTVDGAWQGVARQPAHTDHIKRLAHLDVVHPEKPREVYIDIAAIIAIELPTG